MKYRVAAAFCLLSMFIGAAHGQVVVVGQDGKSGPPPGSPEYCASVEPLRPNLVLTGDTSVKGRVTDQTRAPLKNSPIELRRFISESKQESVKKLSTDADGKFDLGRVKRGEYRLLLSPHRGFKQQEKLDCPSSNCTLDTVLILNPTNQFASSCPIR
jgi:5-hydroxyisourate hydrolase-like protein (transthyretin family)